MTLATFLVRVCAIVGGIYAVSSIFESLLRNSISIFGFGGFGDDHNQGAGRSTMKRVVKKSAVPAPPAVKKEEYGSVNTNENYSIDDDNRIEMENIKHNN